MRKLQSVVAITLLEVHYHRIIYSFLLLTVLLLGLVGISADMSVFARERFVLHFGFLVLDFAGLATILFLCAPALHREIELRTIYMTLSKPITPFEFVVAKFFGYCLALVLCFSFSFICMTLSILLVGGSIPFALSVQIILMLAKWFLLGSIAFCLSVCTTPYLAGAISAGIYLVGITLPSLREHQLEIWNLISPFWPSFSQFHLGNAVLYDLPLGWFSVARCLAYATAWIIVMLYLSTFAIKRRL